LTPVDFYKFSCGGWEKNNPIPADQAGWSVYAKLANDNQQFLWGILEDDAKATNRTPVQQKVGDYFAACMNTRPSMRWATTRVAGVGRRLTR
jgi:putative endopeptidase